MLGLRVYVRVKPVSLRKSVNPIFSSLAMRALGTVTVASGRVWWSFAGVYAQLLRGRSQRNSEVDCFASGTTVEADRRAQALASEDAVGLPRNPALCPRRRINAQDVERRFLLPRCNLSSFSILGVIFEII